MYEVAYLYQLTCKAHGSRVKKQIVKEKANNDKIKLLKIRIQMIKQQ